MLVLLVGVLCILASITLVLASRCRIHNIMLLRARSMYA